MKTEDPVSTSRIPSVSEFDAASTVDLESVPDTLPCPVPPPPTSGLGLRADVPETLCTDLDALMLAASQGDRRAIAALAIAFGPNLIRLAQSEIDRASVMEEEALAADLVAELLEAMAQRALAGSPPERGNPFGWVESVVKRAARLSEFVIYGDTPEEPVHQETSDAGDDDVIDDPWRPPD
jgi:hypothetical protein